MQKRRSFDMNRDSYNLLRVHKVNMILIMIVVLIVLVPVVMNRGFEGSITLLIAGLCVIGLAVMNYFLPIRQYFKGFLFAFITSIIIMTLFYLDGYALNKHYMLMLTIVMAAMYFRKEIILAFSVWINFAFITIYFLRPDEFLGSGEKQTVIFITIFFVQNAIITVLYFTANWGRNLIEASRKREEE